MVRKSQNPLEAVFDRTISMHPNSSIRWYARLTCALLGPLMSLAPVTAQDKPAAKPDRTAQPTATLKGRIVQHPKPDWKIDLQTLEVDLVEFVMDRLPEPQLPDNWNQLTNDQRRQWITEFEASPEGKKLLAEQERILESANTFDVPIEASGEFVVYDVPPGTYGLSGRLDKTLGDYQYAFEVFGQIVVRDDVDEVLLDPIAVVVTPLFEPGQPVPPFAIQSADGQKIKPDDFQDQFVFINVWSDQFSPPSLAFQTQVQEMVEHLGKQQNVQLLSVCLDEDEAKGRATIQQKQLPGTHGFAPGWDHPFAETLGVRALPWFMLIDPEGKIRLTHGQIRTAFAKGKTLEQIVLDGIQGKDPTKDNDAEKPGESP